MDKVIKTLELLKEDLRGNVVVDKEKCVVRTELFCIEVVDDVILDDNFNVIQRYVTGFKVGNFEYDPYTLYGSKIDELGNEIIKILNKLLFN